MFETYFTYAIEGRTNDTSPWKRYEYRETEELQEIIDEMKFYRKTYPDVEFRIIQRECKESVLLINCWASPLNPLL